MKITREQIDDAQKQIDDAIKNCNWRKEVGEFYICRDEVTPCSHVIDKGKCDALIQLFRGDKNGIHED